MAIDLNAAIQETITDALRSSLMHLTLEKRLFTAEEAAVYLGRTPRAIGEMVRQGHLRVASHDRLIRIDVLELDRYCLRHSHERVLERR